MQDLTIKNDIKGMIDVEREVNEMNYWEDKCGGDLRNMKSKERSLTLSQEEVEMLTSQIAYRMDQLDTYIKEKATKGFKLRWYIRIKETVTIHSR